MKKNDEQRTSPGNTGINAWQAAVQNSALILQLSFCALEHLRF